MAYRRRQQVLSSSSSSTSSTSFRFEEEEEDKSRHPLPPPQSDDSLAAKAIRASSAHRDSSFSSAYSARGAQPAVNSSSPTSSLPSRYSNPATTASSSPSSKPHEYTSLKNVNESKHGFWGVLARKAKAILDDVRTNLLRAAERLRIPRYRRDWGHLHHHLVILVAPLGMLWRRVVQLLRKGLQTSFKKLVSISGKSLVVLHKNQNLRCKLTSNSN